MSLSPIASNLVNESQLHHQQSVASTVVPPSAPSALPADTVTLSSAALKASSGDVDHDGDSR